MDIKLEPYLALPIALNSTQIVDWGNMYLQANEVYKNTEGENAIIFILDTAGEFDHPDLIENTYQGLAKNFTNEIGMRDVHGHGTHCAGIAAARNNNFGVIGVAPKAKIVPLKVLNDSGAGSFAWVAAAIEYVANVQLPDSMQHMRKIISISLGGPNPNPLLKKAIEYAIGSGCFIVAAAGNSGFKKKPTVLYPARYDKVIAIASIDKEEQPSTFSSGGKQVDLAAPGEQIYSTHTNSGYAYLSGSSMACPHVTGVVALIVSYFQEIENQLQLNEYLKKFARDIFTEGEDKRTGAGSPVLPIYFDNEPEEPVKEIPRRSEHEITTELTGDTIRWRRVSDKKYKEVQIIDLHLSIRTTMETEYAVDLVRKQVKLFFINRTIILPNSLDLKEAVYHTATFLNLVLRQANINIKTNYIKGIDSQGRCVIARDIGEYSKIENLSTEVLPLEVIKTL